MDSRSLTSELKLHAANRAFGILQDDWTEKLESSLKKDDGSIDPVSRTTPNLMHSPEMRSVSCMVHGKISFNKYIWTFIDTQHFQRLRNLTQLGSLFYVFPAADFSRFEHSLGRICITKKELAIWQISSAKKLSITEVEKDLDSPKEITSMKA